MADMSHFYFNRVFRSTTGIPPRRFHMAIRMREAKRLLLTTGMSVTEICFEVGYSSLGTFASHFHELVGVSPRGLRRAAALPPPCLPNTLCGGVHPPGAGAVSGKLTGCDGAPRVVIVGLFASRLADGQPAACCVLTGASGRYRLTAPQSGGSYVLAAALPASAAPLAYLLPDEEAMLVAAADRIPFGACVVRDLHLRPRQRIDPPILLAPHSLFHLPAQPIEA
jgi:AraC family transcriptional regulator